MKKLLAMSSLALAFFAVSCENEENDENVSAQDRTFVNEITLSNRTEIALSTMALQSATNDSVRSFAQMMIDEHTMAENELKELADDLDIDRPADSLNTMGAAMRTTLMGLSGRAFDSAYINGQIPAHEATLQLVQGHQTSGSNGELRNYAATLQPKIQMHRDRADSIAASFR